MWRDGRGVPGVYVTCECDVRIAGTGKSRALRALQWYALQIGAEKMIAVVAYTWRAALLLGTPDSPACTTTTFFAIDSFSDKNGRHTLRTHGKVSVRVSASMPARR